MGTLIEEHTLVSDGLRLYVRRWPATSQKKGTVVLVHGLGEHGGRYGHVARTLNDQGYDVWAMDLRGHGRSEGPRAYVDSIDEHVRDLGLYLDYVRDQGSSRPDGGTPLFVVAHSLGGCITTLFVIRERPALRGLVLSGPALKLGDDFSPAKIQAGRVLGRWLPRLPIEKLDSRSVSRDPEVVRSYERDPLVHHGWVKTGMGLAFIRATEEIAQRMDEVELPLLVLQGAEDRLVNKEGGAELVRKARSADKRLEVYPELYHEVFNEPERDRVLGDLVQWLGSH